MARKTTDDSSLLFDLPETGPDDRFERAAFASGHRIVAGADEAGRGPLAGPVVAAAVILDWSNVPGGLDDSKQLTARRRDQLFDAIMVSCQVAIASSCPRQIDRTDIRKASLDAMRRALTALPERAGFALFDGRDVPDGIGIAGKAVVKGDARCLSIAAASIVAKVTRDRMMIRAAERYPQYGFDEHMGYGTRAHLDALAELGPCPLHRMSFRPIRQD